jgi:hypothetical protein
MKNSISQIKSTVESIIDRLDHAEERISGTEDEIEKILLSDSSKEKNKNH